MSLKAKIEAVLFMTDKPLRAQAIAGIVGEELQVVRATLLDLIHDYEERQGGLEIADEDGYSFQVRDQFANLMDEFLPIEMSAAQLRTLSAIAIKQPIPQSEIIRIRGAGAYDHIRELVLRGLITKREDEKTRSPLLSTTKQFQEYFRLTKDGKSLRSYLKREMKKKDKSEEDLLVPPLEGDLALDGDLPLERELPLSKRPVDEMKVVAATDSDINDLSFEPENSAPISERAELEKLKAEAIQDAETVLPVLNSLLDDDQPAKTEISNVVAVKPISASPVEIDVSGTESFS